MKCPYCNFEDCRVLDSRSTEEKNAIRRRRECNKCRERFTTYERIEEAPLLVIKKDGTREIFNRNKILNGIIRATEKRGIELKHLEKIARDIEQELRNRMEPEIAAPQIGELVMEHLLELDEVAYVRFASVYRHFKDINKFRQELDRLLGDEGNAGG